MRCPRFPFANRALAEGLFPERNGRRFILKAGSRLRAAAGADGESARKKHPHSVGLERRSRLRLIKLAYEQRILSQAEVRLPLWQGHCRDALPATDFQPLPHQTFS